MPNKISYIYLYLYIQNKKVAHIVPLICLVKNALINLIS